jgi:hypothetical protein
MYENTIADENTNFTDRMKQEGGWNYCVTVGGLHHQNERIKGMMFAEHLARMGNVTHATLLKFAAV